MGSWLSGRKQRSTKPSDLNGSRGFESHTPRHGIAMNKKPKNKFLHYIMTEDPWAKVFWRVWFWWGIRQAHKRRLAWEEHQKTLPQLDTEQYWEMVHKKLDK